MLRNYTIPIPVKVKSSMARSLQVENLLPQNVGVNYQQLYYYYYYY